MDARTRRYVIGRFGDHYRRVSLTPPPEPYRREWGYIPWKEGNGTTMVRHRSLTDLGELGAFLAQERPRHVYYSAGRYDDPAAATMATKGWQGADLIFDLDADHLPGVSHDDDYAAMLRRCKEELYALLDILTEDFAFEDLEIVFSGGRGYHVHVRQEDVRGLPREARREIADYVRGETVALDTLVQREMVAGVGRETPAEVRRLDPGRGWAGRIHRSLMDRIDRLRSLHEAEAVEELVSLEGIGDRRAGQVLDAIDRSYDEIAGGNLDVHPAFLAFAAAVVDGATLEQGAAIDEPVTTDVNRLIRLPGSLHGGSGLVTRRISRDTLEMFDPLEFAIPETFRGQEIAIELEAPTTVAIGGSTRELDAGIARVPEFVGIHLMVTGRATKVSESARGL